MGEANEAQNYRYRFEVVGNGRKLIWEGIPISIRDSHQEMMERHDALIIPINLALSFSYRDEINQLIKLKVACEIWKVK